MGSSVARWARRAGAGQAAPSLLLLGTLTLLAWLLPQPGLYAVKLLLAVAAGGIAASMWQRARRTNQVMARFVTALTQGDLTQGFRLPDQGAGLEELGEALDGALQRVRAERAAAAAENRFAAALLDETPTPLLTVEDGGRVHLANKAARHLFREADGRDATAFARYGGGFAALLVSIAPGGREICDVLWNGLPQRALVTAATIERPGGAIKVIAVDIIHAELRRAELATQADLVRVLTHEIMNSLTPVTSLATSAADLLMTLDPGDASALDDVRQAVATLARRAAGITRFVESYRAFAHVPTIVRQRVPAQDLAQDLRRTFCAMPQASGVTLTIAVDPPRLAIDGDPALLTQMLLNLLKNGAEAAVGHAAEPSVELTFSEEAGRTRISVTDNGPGIPAAIARDIFLPFFTTKPQGTGVGLSFGRLVALLHEGTLDTLPASPSGTEFRVLI